MQANVHPQSGGEGKGPSPLVNSLSLENYGRSQAPSLCDVSLIRQPNVPTDIPNVPLLSDV